MSCTFKPSMPWNYILAPIPGSIDQECADKNSTFLIVELYLQYIMLMLGTINQYWREYHSMAFASNYTPVFSIPHIQLTFTEGPKVLLKKINILSTTRCSLIYTILSSYLARVKCNIEHSGTLLDKWVRNGSEIWKLGINSWYTSKTTKIEMCTCWDVFVSDA